MAGKKRRSDRLMLTIPLQIEGTDRQGVSFKEDGRTVSINRHGARIRLARPLEGGQILRVVNQKTHRQADFRVVGSASYTQEGSEWGVECLNPKDDIWGIHFPPAEDAATDSKGLLQCRKCHTVSFVSLSLVEVDVLETTGVLSRPCETCGATTPWEYAEGAAPTGLEAGAETGTAPAELSFRKGRRVPLQLSLMIRKQSGDVEITQCENVSKGGLCFISEKHYYPEERITVVCPYQAKGQNIEVEAQIARQQPVEGGNRKIYGVRYISEGKGSKPTP